jgi:hypothetical protein
MTRLLNANPGRRARRDGGCAGCCTGGIAARAPSHRSRSPPRGGRRCSPDGYVVHVRGTKNLHRDRLVPIATVEQGLEYARADVGPGGAVRAARRACRRTVACRSANRELRGIAAGLTRCRRDGVAYAHVRTTVIVRTVRRRRATHGRAGPCLAGAVREAASACDELIQSLVAADRARAARGVEPSVVRVPAEDRA